VPRLAAFVTSILTRPPRGRLDAEEAAEPPLRQIIDVLQQVMCTHDANLKAMEFDALREACWMTTHARIERLSARLEKITAELEKRDFSDFSTEKLLELELKTRAELTREFPEPHIRSEEELSNAKARRTAPDPYSYSQTLQQGGDTTLLLEPEGSGNGRKRSRQAD
jgi:hypothetical protein